MDDFIDIRNNFVSFYNSYIEINKYILAKSKTNTIVKELLNEMTTNVLTRLDENHTYQNSISEIKEVQLLGKLVEKSEKDCIDIEMLK